MFFKSKRFWIMTAIVLVIVCFLTILSFGKNNSHKYETVKVERGDLIQTVDVTGKIKSANNVSLHFENNGTVDEIYVIEGEEVHKGDVLAKLNLDDLNSLVEQAEANLNQKIAGVSNEQINVSLKQIEVAEVAYRKAETNLNSIKILAGENLKNKYISALSLIDDIYIKLFTALKDAEDMKKNYFSRLDQDSVNISSKIENIMKPSIEDAKTYIDLAKETKSVEDIEKASSSIDKAVKDSINTLLFIKSISESVNYSGIVATADKAALDQDELTMSASQISLTSTLNEISLLKIQNQNNIDVAHILVEEALANLELQKASYNSLTSLPRDVDLAYLRSVLNQAIANKNKAIITSPISGVITKINKEEGELISSAESLIEVLSPDYQIEVNIPETDVVKVDVGDMADIELDAIDNTQFNSEVVSVDPAATTIQDVVYYRVVLNILDEDDRIKPGMTADILIYTDKKENVLYLPSRSILSEGERKYVRVIENNEIIEKDVVIGLNADDSKKEILFGLSVGEEIVLKILN
ncbi:MAG: efflux RND transporter periplasmic adaptor subunit [Candidatus Pacebacteria bacterium]|nr:efflux RND transporter periplasmic adaptor subunit [Candidatus Paceibacterota bacterium]